MLGGVPGGVLFEEEREETELEALSRSRGVVEVEDEEDEEPLDMEGYEVDFEGVGIGRLRSVFVFSVAGGLPFDLSFFSTLCLNIADFASVIFFFIPLIRKK